MLIAQFSDTHIKPEGHLAYSVVDTHQMLAQAIDHLLHLPQQPDVMVISGDLVDAGSVIEYERLAALLARLPMPVLMVPGNHDDRDNMRQVFRDHPGISTQGFWQFALQHDGWPVRIVGLDTVMPGDSAGSLCDERLSWLESVLTQAPDTPTLMVMHHPLHHGHWSHGRYRVGKATCLCTSDRAAPTDRTHCVRPSAPTHSHSGRWTLHLDLSQHSAHRSTGSGTQCGG